MPVKTRNDGKPFTPEQLKALDQLRVFDNKTEDALGI